MFEYFRETFGYLQNTDIPDKTVDRTRIDTSYYGRNEFRRALSRTAASKKKLTLNDTWKIRRRIQLLPVFSTILITRYGENDVRISQTTDGCSNYSLLRTTSPLFFFLSPTFFLALSLPFYFIPNNRIDRVVQSDALRQISVGRKGTRAAGLEWYEKKKIDSRYLRHAVLKNWAGLALFIYALK